MITFVIKKLSTTILILGRKQHFYKLFNFFFWKCNEIYFSSKQTVYDVKSTITKWIVYLSCKWNSSKSFSSFDRNGVSQCTFNKKKIQSTSIVRPCQRTLIYFYFQSSLIRSILTQFEKGILQGPVDIHRPKIKDIYFNLV